MSVAVAEPVAALRRGGWWQERAACAGMAGEFDLSETTKLTRLTCGGCPVRPECLSSALEAEGQVGASRRFCIRGGLTPSERAALARKRMPAGGGPDGGGVAG